MRFKSFAPHSFWCSVVIFYFLNMRETTTLNCFCLTTIAQDKWSPIRNPGSKLSVGSLFGLCQVKVKDNYCSLQSEQRRTTDQDGSRRERDPGMHGKAAALAGR